MGYSEILHCFVVVFVLMCVKTLDIYIYINLLFCWMMETVIYVNYNLGLQVMIECYIIDGLNSQSWLMLVVNCCNRLLPNPLKSAGVWLIHHEQMKSLDDCNWLTLGRLAAATTTIVMMLIALINFRMLHLPSIDACNLSKSRNLSI